MSFVGCPTGNDPATFRATGGRSTIELRAPRLFDFFGGPGWNRTNISGLEVHSSIHWTTGPSYEIS